MLIKFNNPIFTPSKLPSSSEGVGDLESKLLKGFSEKLSDFEKTNMESSAEKETPSK